MFLSDACVSKETQQMVIMQVFVRSFGCSANTADSEVLSGCLAAAGYTLAKSETEAQLIIYNSCAVKGPTENRIIYALKRIPPTKKIVVAGCLPLISLQRLMKEVRFDAAVGPAVGKNIVDVVQRVLNGGTIVDLEGALTSKPKLNLPRKQTNPIISIIPINYGCLGSCAYCCVVHARGHLRSCKIDEIVDRVKLDVAAGAKEFWVTSQDAACYGRDLKTNLATLLKEIAKVEGTFPVRVGMMTPNLTLDMLSDIIEAFQNEHVFKFVHLPVQSGDNHVLKRMNRLYSVEGFKLAIGAFRDAIPSVTVATDVICGFPSESHNAFDRSLRLIEEIRPDVVNISKFFPRPNTTAEKMTPKVPQTEVSKRSREAASLAARISFEKNREWLNWEGPVLIDELGKQPNTFIGRNFAYKPVVVKNCDPSLLGTFQKVKVTEAFQTYLEARILD